MMGCVEFTACNQFLFGKILVGESKKMLDYINLIITVPLLEQTGGHAGTCNILIVLNF